MACQPIYVLGLGADGPASLAPRLRDLIAGADFLAGGRRHLALVGPSGAETMAITGDLDALADRLGRRAEGERCVVLASGDPLFYGIGRFLIRRLGPGPLRFEPAITSMALAFARAGLAWDDATIASIHGRDLKATLLPLLGRPKIALFTGDGDGPAEVARFFLARGLPGYRAWVGEDLGASEERSAWFGLEELAERSFFDLNLVILERLAPGREGEPADRETGVPGRPDLRFAQPESGPRLLTHADVRAVTLARFRDLPPGPIWDVGAGLGGVSVELARAFPGREVVAFERSEDQLPYLRRNRLSFEAYNLRIEAGEAPEALAGEADRPSGVFLGGSGGRLDAILDRLFARLEPGGVLVANFVGLEHLARMLDRARGVGWPVEVVQVQVAEGRALAGLTTFVPLRPVWIARAIRPAAEGGS